jgi:hypothetical protein
VRESVQRYPGLEAVFDKHGLGGCGGPDGPIEPIAFFARVHQVDPAALLRELNEFAARRDGAAAIPLMDERPTQATQPYFIAVIASLAIAVLGGFPLGTWRHSALAGTSVWAPAGHPSSRRMDAVNGAEACGPYTGGHSKHWPSKATGLAMHQAMVM